jgi:aryl-alcohol dehydrogenase-like predicted oxidoreductase
MLTGKYRAGEPFPDDSRFARHLPPDQASRIVNRDSARVQRLSAWATNRGRSVAELAIAWLACQPIVGSVIAGVTKPEQVEANARAARWSLTVAEISEVGSLGKEAP